MTELLVRVVSARNLIDTQTFRRQDPYCKLKIGSQKFKTRVDNNGDRDPVWNEKFVFQVPDVQFGQLHIQIKDDGYTSDELIGECILPISQFQHGAVVDQWFPLNRSSQRAGEINLRVQLVGGYDGMMKGQVQGYPAAMPYNPQQQAYPPPQQTPYAQPAPYAQAPPQQYPPNYPVPQQGYPQAAPQPQYAQVPPQPVYVQQQPTVVAAPPPVVVGASPVVVGAPTTVVATPATVVGAPTAVVGTPGVVVVDRHHRDHHHHGDGAAAAALGVGAGVLGGMLLGEALDDLF